jgi:hypothetical protein
MDNDMYDLRVTFRIKLKRWRIDDQSNISNREWALKVYDRNLERWWNVNDLNRPGEESYIESIEEVSPRGAIPGP